MFLLVQVIFGMLVKDETLGDRTSLTPDRIAELLEVHIIISATGKLSLSKKKAQPCGL